MIINTPRIPGCQIKQAHSAPVSDWGGLVASSPIPWPVPLFWHGQAKKRDLGSMGEASGA